jgi:hypothetical protein
VRQLAGPGGKLRVEHVRGDHYSRRDQWNASNLVQLALLLDVCQTPSPDIIIIINGTELNEAPE